MILKPLDCHPLQSYLTNKLQLFNIVESCLEQTGAAHVYISTFSASEEFARKIFRFKKQGLVLSATLLLDYKASAKTARVNSFVSQVFDEVYLADNHSKVVLIANDKWRVSICTSQNQTRGNRIEGGIITTDVEVYNTLYQSYTDIINISSAQYGTL